MLPPGWSPATETADKPGQVTVQMGADVGAATAAAILDTKFVTASGRNISVTIEALDKEECCSHHIRCGC